MPTNDKIKQARCRGCNKVLFEIAESSKATVFKKCERCKATSAISFDPDKDPVLLRFTPHNNLAQTAAAV